MIQHKRLILFTTLLLMSSCVKNETTSSIPTTSQLKNAPLIDDSALSKQSSLSPIERQKIRKKLKGRFGSNIHFGRDDQTLLKFLEQGKKVSPKKQTTLGDFAIQFAQYPKCDGTTPGGSSYNNIGALHDLGLVCGGYAGEEYTGDWDAVYQCYNESGGEPLYDIEHICVYNGSCYDVAFNAVYHDCCTEGNNYCIPSDFSLSTDSDFWFSPLEGSAHPAMGFQVTDSASEGWELKIKKAGQVYKVFSGVGSESLSWDGKTQSGELAPEGKYNAVLHSYENKSKVRKAKFGMDLTPPEIVYEIINKPGQGKDKLKVIITDRQSGVEHTATKVETINTEGAPVIQNKITAQETIKDNKHVSFYELLFPSEPPSTQTANEGGFSVASLGTEPSTIAFANISAMNTLGLLAKRVTNFNTANKKAIPRSGPCGFGKNDSIIDKNVIQLHAAYDFDRAGSQTKDVTLYFKLFNLKRNKLGGYDTTGTYSPSGTAWLKKITINGSNSYINNSRDRAQFTSDDESNFFADNLTDISYGGAILPSKNKNLPRPEIDRGEGFLHLSINMNRLAESNKKTTISLNIPSRSGVNHKLKLEFTPSKIKGENWKSIKCIADNS